MSYLALARKWRPSKFSEVVGQSHVLTALESSTVLASDCLIYIETESELTASGSSSGIPASWIELKAKKAGQVSYRLFRASLS